MWKKYAAPLPQSPEVTVSQKGAVTLKGDTPNPAQVSTKTSDGVLSLPEGSTFVFNEKLGTLSVTLAKASQMALNRTETEVKGPVAFQPPKAPTASELADAEADASNKKKLYGFLFAGVAAAIFGLVRQWNWVMYGGASVAAASLFGLVIAKSLNEHPWVFYVIVAGLVVAVAGPVFYHVHLKHLEPANERSPTTG